VAVYETKLFDDMVINVLACDKAIPMDKLKAALAKDGTDDSFMLWEPNVKATFKANGEPMFMNSWAGGASLSVSGGGISGDLVVKDGIARGKFALASDDKGKCDFTFNVPMTAPPAKRDDAKKSLQAGGAGERPKGTSKAEGKAEEEPVKPAKPKPTLSIYRLPLPKDAAKVEYKTLVEQLKFTSAASHTALAKSFSDQLAAAGWKKADDDLVAAKSAILHRKQGTAELTIIIKPADSGSTVTVFTENMNWDKPADAAAGK